MSPVRRLREASSGRMFFRAIIDSKMGINPCTFVWLTSALHLRRCLTTRTWPFLIAAFSGVIVLQTKSMVALEEISFLTASTCPLEELW
jgi:hypothetical protein